MNRKSKGRSRRRRSHDGVKPPQLHNCPNCQTPIPRHVICPTCGAYMGRAMIEEELPRGKDLSLPRGRELPQGIEQSLVVELQIPDNATDEEIEAATVEAAKLADELHRSYGGHGLKVDEIDVSSAVRVDEVCHA